MSSFFANILSQKMQTKTVGTENLPKTLLYKKAAHKMLVELIPGVNFTNI